MADSYGLRAPVTAPELLLKIVLAGTQSHYEHRGLIDDARLEQMLLAGKQILWKSHQESDVRQNLGFSHAVWQGLSDVLTSALPVLELQSFSWKNPPAASFNGSSSDLIASNYFILVKDIERLNDLCTIARNLLATTKKAQNLAAEKTFDQQILKLIDVCVRVTARGFDGETNARNEERWQKVVNLYKRLLITCLQFLHNFIMHNEHRKLVLWLDLFGNVQQSAAAEQAAQQQQPQRLPKTLTPEEIVAQTAREARIKTTVENLPEGDQLTAEGGLGYNIDDVHDLFDLMSTEEPPEPSTQEAARLLMDKIRSDMERFSGLSASELDDDPEALLKVGASLRSKLPIKDFPVRPAEPKATTVVNLDRTSPTSHTRAVNAFNLADLSQYGDVATGSLEITDEDMIMPRTSQSAAETLQEAKDELMARLQETPLAGANGDDVYHTDDPTQYDDIASSASASVASSASDNSSYRSPGDQERGLLTDVPLVLGPTEIEALPMIIQAGIVDNFGLRSSSTPSPNNAATSTKNMQAVRCHILLAQESGRNVLRELLIFIAAWDLPDDEFYFKMMVQIMEAILKNGLMSHAYADFGQAKDIISPAQAVVIKILTHIFRARYSPASVSSKDQQNQNHRPTSPSTRLLPLSTAPLIRVDVLTVRYIFTVFRGNIIPETCALIYLQGQIRAGHALAEDFPLNLWDMERVYEGVYQFLEFFAVLTESNEWKVLLVDWEIVYDLVTLIKELDASIPKAGLKGEVGGGVGGGEKAGGKEKERNGARSGSGFGPNSSTPASTSNPTPISIERPYSPLPTPSPNSKLDSSPSPSSPPPPPPLSAEDPADFEWRNLKKLIVLVLSSLVWKSKTVQDQIREHGGLDVILGCTMYDGHNPYIKEHAVMCLKFLLEGNETNQALVGGLHGREVVEKPEGMGVEVGIEEGTGRVRVKQAGGTGKGLRRASEGNVSTANPAGVRERFGKLDVNGGGSPAGGARDSEMTGRVIGEELDDL